MSYLKAYLSIASEWELRALSGALIAQGEGTEIDMSGVQAGIYFVELHLGETSLTKKIIKE